MVYFDAMCANGIRCGEVNYGNNQFIQEMHEGIRLINENTDGYVEKIPELKSGEIYLPLGLKPKIECEAGDTVTVDIIEGVSYEFKIMGFVEDIVLGSMNIGWKQIFISHEDYVKIYEACKPLVTDDVVLDAVMMSIYKEEECSLLPAQFQRKLNLDTNIVSQAVGSMNIEQSVYYTKILTDMVMNIVLTFVALLFIVILIVINYSIGTEIEIDYTNLGILKSQGFTKGKIRLIFILRYVLAQLFGIALGTAVSIPLERKISRECQAIIGLVSQNGFDIEKSLLFEGAILIISVALILIKTVKISKISPVRAILSGHEEIFFDSRTNLPITGKALSASLSFRQITSAKKRYIGTVCIVAILTFCMITINLSGNMLSSYRALSSMGVVSPDFQVYYTDEDRNVEWEEIDKLVEDHSPIMERNSQEMFYASLNGESLLCQVFMYPEEIKSITKGRAPLYENEIMTTEIVADLLGINMGDEVIVSFKTKENKYIVSGIYQSVSDTGRSFLMSLKGAKRNGKDIDCYYMYYMIKDKSEIAAITEDISEKYGDTFNTYIYDGAEIEQFEEIILLLKLIIYTFSILFAFIVIRMVCTKAFIQERITIGIYKALGFTVKRLRIQFAIRFFIVAAAGSFIGLLLSILFSEKTLSLLLSATGLKNVVIEYTPMTILIPVAAISISFYIFSFIASGKIKKVEVRELVTE